MSLNDNQEEFSILLEMGKQDEHSNYLSPKIKLFNMWTKRVPLRERKQIFQNTPNRLWKQLNYPANIWACEQKMLLPQDIDCSVETLWPVEMYVPDDIPNLVLDRLSHLLDRPSTTAKVAVEYILGVEDTSNNWQLCVKDVQSLKKLNEIIARTAKKSSSLASALINAFPPSVGKKIAQLDDSISASNAAVTQLISALNKKSLSVQKEMAALAAIDPSSVLVNEDLVGKITRHFESNSYSYFKKNTDILLQGGWSQKEILKLAPKMATYTELKVIRDFLPFWLGNPSMVKEIKKTAEHKMISALNAPVKEIDKTIKWFKELRSAGVTQNDFTKWFGAKRYSDFWGGLYDAIKYSNKLAASVEKNTPNMIGVLPDQMIGTLMIFKHLADHKPLDSRFPSLKISSEEETEKELEASYYFSQKDLQKLHLLEADFRRAVEKVNIACAIPSSSKTNTRKM